MSIEPISQNNQSTTKEPALFVGLYKAYADCSEWCREKHPPGSIPPSQLEQMLQACQRECRQFQARSPANTL